MTPLDMMMVFERLNAEGRMRKNWESAYVRFAGWLDGPSRRLDDVEHELLTSVGMHLSRGAAEFGRLTSRKGREGSGNWHACALPVGLAERHQQLDDAEFELLTSVGVHLWWGVLESPSRDADDEDGTA